MPSCILRDLADEAESGIVELDAQTLNLIHALYMRNRVAQDLHSLE